MIFICTFVKSGKLLSNSSAAVAAHISAAIDQAPDDLSEPCA
jgi:hypothetical protein